MSKTRNSDPHSWTYKEQQVLARLDTAEKVQQFLDNLEYSTEPGYQPPRHVMQVRRAHCFDGALFAAAAMRMHGRPPLIMDLIAVRDDDHVVAIYRQNGRYGAVAKSNFSGLRWREPVYRSLRELAISYFEHYYNFEGERTLRAYSVPMKLQDHDSLEWMTSSANLERLATMLDNSRHYRLLDAKQERRLSRMDNRSFASGLHGANMKAVSGVAARYRKLLGKT